MVDHTAEIAIPIFNAVFPGCQAVSLLSMHPLMQLELTWGLHVTRLTVRLLL